MWGLLGCIGGEGEGEVYEDAWRACEDTCGDL